MNSKQVQNKFQVMTVLPKTLWAAIVYNLYGFVPRPFYYFKLKD